MTESTESVPPKQHIRVLVFDTETTGLIPKRRPGEPYPPSEEYPYITQLSWILYNVEHSRVEETFNSYIRIPDEVAIGEVAMQITGITKQILEEKGQPILPALLKFYAAYMKCDVAVAHNVWFDRAMIRQEIYRNSTELCRQLNVEDYSSIRGILSTEFNQQHEIELYCTMMNSIQMCNLTFGNNSNRKKFPKLQELYTHLFPESTIAENLLHNSIVDVIVCLRCFLQMRDYSGIEESRFQKWLADSIPPTHKYNLRSLASRCKYM
jgi:DNA polymerase III epsilon subunit-like protein